MKELIGKKAILKTTVGCLCGFNSGQVVEIVSVEPEDKKHPLTVRNESYKGYTHPDNLTLLTEQPKESNGVVIVTIENLTIQGTASDVVQVLKLLK